MRTLIARALGLGMLGLGAAVLSGCVSPEEQQAMDMQKCSGFGFQPGSDAMANCMMRVTQQREAQQAEDRRAADRNRLISEQREKDRETAEQARQSEDDRHATDDSQRPNDSLSGISISAMPDISNMDCTSATIENAGSLSCHSK